jgi:glutamate racemase
VVDRQVVVLAVAVADLGNMIGIFDSGSGGLSVLRALRDYTKTADIVYFGDLKNAPYGNRERAELDVLTALGMQTLRAHGATYIVSACNSVAVSTKPMCTLSGFPFEKVVEMVGPTVHSFLHTQARVLVLATRATVASRIYQDEFRKIGIEAVGVALPNLVTLIEGEGDRVLMEEMVHKTLSESLSPDFTHVILGCTHFPLVRDVFEKVLASLEVDVVLVDPAESVAHTVMTHFDTSGESGTRFLVSARSQVFESFLKFLFPNTLPNIEVI